ncbi:RHS repeat-associated core domain-containing protein [Nakamurella flavida]|uniref:RHS repeat-associated core domain-containing protein n=1 Tax=Nakamurella flavida TaxID=363630 RepID=A0A939C1W7_9ACTN|nr:RHS repeat-associated core domain-containing protein [Nakamurella flavida]MBM9478123.1 RHS repeat-associated core domain-containing protein [Nakamurella flavida]MDP9778655.1 RHS repeat-associated protein [Nakamurella flavida]
MTSVKDFAGRAITFGYDHDHALTTTGYPDGVTVTNTFDKADRLTQTVAAKGSTVITTLGYGLDSAGQVTSQTAGGATQTFAYSSREQLTSSTGGATGSGGTAGYAMDAANHPTTVGGATQAFDPAGQQCWSTTTAVTTPTCGTIPTVATTFTFDGVGERTKSTPANGPPSTYGYDQAGRLTSASTPAGSGKYTYNGDGIRTSKTVGATTTRYTWDAATNLLSDGTNNYLYGPDGAPIEQVGAAGAYYFVHDQIGSTRTLLDSTGADAGRYSYTPYGQATHTGTAASPLQYTGQYTDTETGLLYLRARYYDPTTAQFLTIDPLVGSTGTPYAYVNGNPLNDADPTGLCGFWCIAAIVVIDVGEEVLTDGAASAALPEEDAAIAAAFDGGCAAAESATKGGVYVLKEEGTVVRTGRTNNLKVRERQHANDPELQHLDFDTVHRSDVYEEQRGLEQKIYDANPQAQKVNGGYNKIRPISPKSPRLGTYQQAANRHLRGDRAV